MAATHQHHLARAPLLLAIILLAAAASSAARDLDLSLDAANNPAAATGRNSNPEPATNYGGFYGGGFGGGGGWGGGAGYGGGGGGGVEVPTTVVCEEKGSPCYGKTVACPKRCFWSYSRSGNGYGTGGGGGSCTVDCKAKCTATC